MYTRIHTCIYVYMYVPPGGLFNGSESPELLPPWAVDVAREPPQFQRFFWSK